MRSRTGSSTSYANQYRGIDFRKHPEKYRIGKGEQGVLIAEPYKSELLPLWRFKTPEDARESGSAIHHKFIEYREESDFVGMDMARKFLQMGYTRARRYANHPTGKKYDSKGNIRPQAEGAMESEKAESARIFYEYYLQAKNDPKYKRMKKAHQNRSTR
eukprot:gb/GECG01011794.1/.p1 GENE.gb/GECG01011794.1/~~gb/GECG01011794.1/.p1  ORF type:complete len:159 (+),score=18.43 gb/GECG01011794.1/:1-477(+)